MKQVIIIADLGHFKAYRVIKESGESPRLELIESYDSIEAHGKLSEKLSDKAGNFGEGVGRNTAATGSGEDHNLKLENKKRLVKLIAKDINSLIAEEDCREFYLAAPGTINSKIVAYLEPVVRNRMSKNIEADLTKTARAGILKYFR